MDKSITLKMIDEVVYIDDNIDSQEDIIFIPLDDNWVENIHILNSSYFFKLKKNP